MRSYVTNDALIYDALFRHYRNAVVEHVRVCLRVDFGEQALARLITAFGGDGRWHTLKENAETSEAKGAQARTRADDFDYLDIGHFDQVVDHFYRQLTPARWHGSVESTSKHTLRLWVQELKAARDPSAHPGHGDATVSDALRVVGTVRRVLDRMGIRSPNHGQIDDIEQELLRRAQRPEELAAVAPLDDTLPPAESVVEEFVGRGQELEQLRAWLAHPTKNRWMLVGDGGKGKSALAYRLAIEVLEAAPAGLCAVFWLSAKRRRYHVDRIVDIASPDFSNLDDFMDRLLSDYGHRDLVTLPQEDRRAQVLELLHDLPCLLIVDDLDSIDEEDEDVVEFLTIDAPRTGSKVLITSRRKFAGMGSTLTSVVGMNSEDALEFIDTRWRNIDLDADLLSDKHRRRIAEVCEGSPLYMGDLLRLCATASVRQKVSIGQAIEDWASKDGETVRRYALEREMEMLTKPARRALEVLAIGARPLTIEELARVGSQTETAAANAIDELRQLYLVSAPGLAEDTPRFQIDGNLAVLVRSELQGAPSEAAIKNAFASISGSELEEAATNRVKDLSRQARLLINSRRLLDAEALLLAGIDETPESPHLMALLGFCYAAWEPRRAADARTQFARAAQLNYSDRGMYLAWARIEGEAGRWPEAVAVADRGRKLTNDMDPQLLRAAGQTRISLARQHLNSMSIEKAEIALKEAGTILEQAIAVAKRKRLRATDISIMYGLWVTAARVQDRPKAACYRLRDWKKWNAKDRGLAIESAAQASDCKCGEHVS